MLKKSLARSFRINPSVKNSNNVNIRTGTLNSDGWETKKPKEAKMQPIKAPKNS
jgi:hypothetical protein